MVTDKFTCKQQLEFSTLQTFKINIDISVFKLGTDKANG